MAVTATSGVGFSQESALSIQEAMEQMRMQFNQLSRDVEAGNAQAAQEDLVTLESLASRSSPGSSLQGSQLILEASEQVYHDLESREAPNPQAAQPSPEDPQSAAAKGNLSSTSFDA